LAVLEGVFDPSEKDYGTDGLRKVLEDSEAPSLRGKKVLVIGCGSGIDALVVEKLGAREVVAVDIDPRAVASTLINVRRYGRADRVRVFQQNGIPPGETFDVIIWNAPEPRLDRDVAPVRGRNWSISMDEMQVILNMIPGALPAGGHALFRITHGVNSLWSGLFAGARLDASIVDSGPHEVQSIVRLTPKHSPPPSAGRTLNPDRKGNLRNRSS
jgi:SAM-dependent methyltransferase